MRRRVVFILMFLLAACGGAQALSSGDGGSYGGGGDCEHPHDVYSGGYGHETTTTTTDCPTPNTQIGPTTSVRAPGTMIPICHKENGEYTVIEIRADALEDHLTHGDIYPVPHRGCPSGHTTTTKPSHETTTTKPGGGGTTTTVRSTTTVPGGGGTTTTTIPGGGGTTTTTTPGGGGSTTTTTAPPPGGTTTTTVRPPVVPPGPTTTLPATFQFAGAATVCRAEVPTIVIDFQNALPSLAGVTGTLTMSDVNGNVVSSQPLVYQPGGHVELLYPGTRVNPDGSIADVPGWNLTNAGLWVRDPADEFLREGILLTYTVNPTATSFITYPPESSACANPENPPGVRTPPRTPPPAAPPSGLLPPTL